MTSRKTLLLVAGALLAANQAALGFGDDLLAQVFGQSVAIAKFSLVIVGSALGFVVSQTNPEN